MRFALVDGRRQEAQRGLKGKCRGCDKPLTPKCGERRAPHWAHQKEHPCTDKWWENEGEWHRKWKSEFPDDWQEVPHPVGDGTRHIADIKTAHGWVVELQHSPISPQERRSRDAFYRQLVWVVDGTHRKRDAKQFARAWNDGTPVGSGYPVRRLYTDDCRLLSEWADSQTPIFIDFGGEQLCWILPGRLHGSVYVTLLHRSLFIHMHRTGVVQEGLTFAGLVKELSELVARYEAHRR